MISYITLGTSDLRRAEIFYDNVLAALGYRQLRRSDVSIAYHDPNDPSAPELIIGRPFSGEVAAGNGVMIGLRAASESQVRDFHQAALASGGSNEGDPGPRPHYGSPHYFLAYVRDPSGNKLSAFFDGTSALPGSGFLDDGHSGRVHTRASAPPRSGRETQ